MKFTSLFPLIDSSTVWGHMLQHKREFAVSVIWSIPLQRHPHLMFLWWAVDLNTKLRKIVNGWSLILSLWTCDYWKWTFNRGFNVMGHHGQRILSAYQGKGRNLKVHLLLNNSIKWISNIIWDYLVSGLCPLSSILKEHSSVIYHQNLLQFKLYNN